MIYRLPDWLDDPKWRLKRHITSAALGPKIPDPNTPARQLCRWCHGKVPRGCRSWCSNACVEQFQFFAWPAMMARKVLARDKGVCAVCGLDTLEVARLRRASREAWRRFHTFTDHDSYERHREGWHRAWGTWGGGDALWAAHHVIPVERGGGCCGLENLITLCIGCHKMAHGSKRICTL